MAGSLQPRVKVWIASEDVTATDLNAEFDNLLTAMQPLLMDDYSTDVTQMRMTADPGEVGTESLATTLAGELARIRHMLSEITGEDQWYTSPISSLLGLSNAVGSGLTDNRLVSGRVLSTSAQPAFLIANGAARTVKVDGAPTAFTYYVDGVEYSIETDVTLTNLTAAPSTNNTCLVNDSNAADQYWTKYSGEDGSVITVDTMGTEISSLVGKLAAFSIDNGPSTEYFIAHVDSTTRLSRARRGFFFDSTDAPIPRIFFSNNDVITLMKLTWVFATTTGTLTATYNPPIWSADEPTSPSLGDYWFDLANNTWKVRSISTFDVANAVLIGVCIQDDTNTIAARSFEFFKNYSELNTLEVIADSNTVVKSRYPGNNISVWGNVLKADYGFRTWDITLHRDTGVSESSSTYYYLYLTETGDQVISDIKPYNRREDLNGYYHPHQSWRCVGSFYNNGSSNIADVESYFSRYPERIITPAQTAAMNIEVIPKIIRLDGTSGGFTEFLPPAALTRGQEFIFIRTDDTPANAVTLDGFSSETISGSTTYALYTQKESLKIFSDGSGYEIISHYAKTPWANAGALTVTSSGGSVVKGTTSRDAFYWRREGQDVLYRYEYVQTGSGTAGTGAYIYALPAYLPFISDLQDNGQSTTSAAGSIIGDGTISINTNFAGARTHRAQVKPWSSTSFYILHAPQTVSSADGWTFLILGGSATGLVSGTLDFGDAAFSSYIWGTFPVSGWKA